MASGRLRDSDGACRRDVYRNCSILLVTGHKKSCSKKEHFNEKEFAMKDKRRAYEEKFDTQLQSCKDLKTGAKNAWDEIEAAHPPRGIKVQRSMTTSHAANSYARTLAEAIILQSIEDLWNPVCRKGSRIFFEGDGFVLCSGIAGISYIEKLTMMRMLAEAGQKLNLCNTRKAL